MSLRLLTVDEAVRIIQAGGVVAIPTETVYGLGADALNPQAVSQIFAIKERPHFNPLICHLPNANSVFNFGKEDPVARRLAENFWPGPLTILLEHENKIPSIVTAGSELCAFRVPAHPLTLELLEALGSPLAAPSANRFGRISPTSVSMVESGLGERIAGCLDGGVCQVGIESTIVEVVEHKVKIHRPGGITVEMFEAAGFELESAYQRVVSQKEQATPGKLLHHYAPRTPLIYINVAHQNKDERLTASLLQALSEKLPELDLDESALITFGSGNTSDLKIREFNLSVAGDFKEAAVNLFAIFDSIDREDYSMIVALGLPDRDLGRAINDRLFKAAAWVADFSGNQIENLRKK